MSTSTDDTRVPETEARLEALAREYADLNARREPIENRMQEIRAEFRNLLDYGTSRHAGQTISIQHNPIFDEDAFRAAYPVGRYPHLYKQAPPDRAAIKENLAPAEVRAFHTEGAPKVVITR